VLAGLAAIAGGLTHGAFVQGHPAEAITPLLWVLAAIDARRGRAGRAGLLLGVSAGIELWGVLGLPVLLLAPSLRSAARGVAIAVGIVVAQLAPFAVAGDFRMFDYRWRVSHATLISAFMPAGSHFGWPLRLLQAAVACGIAAALAVRARRSVHALWLVPLAIALARIVLDPVANGWYWLEVEALTLVGAALLLDRLPLLVKRREVRVQEVVAPEERHDGTEREERPEGNAHLPRRSAVLE
jgi:hypothetical protein